MIITRTPFRMSFFGGGSDIPEFFNKNRGSVISSTFDKYCYVTVRHLPPFFEYTTELSYSVIERVTRISDIQHPAVRNAMKMLDMHELRITYEADLPARTGLGTSSSFAVGLLNAFHSLKGQYIDKRTIANEAIYLERTLCAETGGWQDQIAASYGGLNRIDFENGQYDVYPIIIPPERKKLLNNNLLMFFTGFSRYSAEIQNAAVPIADRIGILNEMVCLVDEAEKILSDTSRSLDDFGLLLDETWKLKKKSNSKVTLTEIDEAYDIAVSAGALGGKILGAGGGGFLVFYVPACKQEEVIERMKTYLQVPFMFEEEGTRVVYFSPEIYDVHSRKREFE